MPGRRQMLPASFRHPPKDYEPQMADDINARGCQRSTRDCRGAPRL